MIFLRPQFYGKRLLIDPLTRNESLVLIGTGGIWVVLIFIYFLLITMPALLISLLIPFKALEDNLDDINVLSCNICKEKVGVFFEGKIAECPNCNHTIEYNFFSKIGKLIGQLFLSVILSYILLLSILTVLSILI